MAKHNLSELVDALTKACVSAVNAAQKEGLKHFYELFRRERDPESGNARLRPRTFHVEIPAPLEEGAEEKLLKGPLISLISMPSLEIEKIEMEFYAQIKGLEDSEKEYESSHIEIEMLDQDESKDNSNAKITIVMKSGDAPEGIVKLRERLIREIE